MPSTLKPYTNLVDFVTGREMPNIGAEENRQVTAIAEHVERKLRKQKVKPLGVEGAKEGQWVLLDYGHVIIHVFYESVRQFYDLEGLWTDARRIEMPGLKKHKTAARRTPSRDADE